MKKVLAAAVTVATIGAAALSAAPASAASFGISVGFPAASFSYNSGGYCDAWGCPGDYWNYPIYYCPIYYDHRWFGGPFYYRSIFGRTYYWIHGDWRPDYWRGPRPPWACVDRFGPPLDLDFYIWNGFIVRDEWRYAWRHKRDAWWHHRQDWDHDHHGDRRWQAWLPQAQKKYDWNREHDWNRDRDWIKPNWNRGDWQQRNHIDHGAKLPPTVVKPPVVVGPPPPTEKKDRFDWRKGGRGRLEGSGVQGGDQSGDHGQQPNWNPPGKMNNPSDGHGAWKGQGGTTSGPTGSSGGSPQDNDDKKGGRHGGRDRDNQGSGRGH